MAQGSAIQQAKDMFDKLVNLKINQAPMPKSIVKNYAVAALPGGRMLMGTGKTKMSSSANKRNVAMTKDRESLAPMGQQQKSRSTIGDLLLQIAVPPGQVGVGEDKAFTFANYLNGLLRPQMPTAPGVGAPALLPDPRTIQKFNVPSAIANLPPILKRPEESFESPLAKYGTFMENTARIQKELAKRFLAQFNRGERGAAYSALGARGKAPLVSKYDENTSSYRLPAPKSATTSEIRPQRPTFNAATIY